MPRLSKKGIVDVDMLFHHGNYIRIDASRCLNRLHNGVECSHCVANCPGQALVLSNHEVNFVHDNCIGCGLCFADCPTQVFGSNQWDETTIILDVKAQGAKETQIFCGNHSAPCLSKEEKGKGAIRIPTCLSSLSKGVWYDIGLITAVELRLDECEQCTMKSTLGRMNMAVETAIEWLSASGHIPDFAYIDTAEKNQGKKKYQAAESGLKVTSRRDLFLSVIKKVKEPRFDSDSFEGTGDAPGKKRQDLLPDWQKRFEESYKKHYQEGGSPAFWPNIQISSNCVKCGMCAKYCPTQALKITVDNRESIHTFISGRCLDCRVCMLFCPTQSIVRNRNVDDEPFKYREIYKIPVEKCERCKADTIVNEKVLCYWCEKEPPQEELLSDMRKKLFKI